MLFTTSDNFTSNEIENYFGLVDSHIVIGANLFKDVFASFRDIFGGETKGYKREIAKLKKAALSELESKAKKLGANAVIAIKVDLDEVSGGAKSMFMYNISGTAVKLKEVHAGIDIENTDTLSKDEFDDLKDRIKKTERILSNQNIVNDVGIVSKNNIWNHELYAHYCEAFFKDESNPIQFYYHIKEVPPKFYENDFFNNFDKLKLSQFNSVLDSLKAHNWYDVERIIKLISNDNYIIRLRGLKLILLERKYYSGELIEGYERIKQHLIGFNDEVIKRKEERKLTRTKYYFVCSSCLTEIEYKEDLYCEFCDANVWGFSRNNSISNHYDILDELEIRIKALQTIQSTNE